MGVTIDVSNRKFGRLTALCLLRHTGPKGQRIWHCMCECGKEINTRQCGLMSGNTKSCGCSRRRHNASHTKTYFVWRSMISRCYQPSSQVFHLYGARGIRVCRRWRKFENFLYDMGKAPSGFSLDRIDNNRGYNKKNCRWASQLQQCGNMRTNHMITYRGRTLHASGWARSLGIKVPTIFARLRRGLPIKRVLERKQ